MAQQYIYPVRLLNDIHNYFPDILYNPSRFRSVQDLLDYIRSVADSNPYARGLQLYNMNNTSNTTNTVQQQNNTAAPPRNYNTRTVTRQGSIPPTIITTIFDETTIPSTIPLNGATPSPNINSLLSGIISEFMNEAVNVNINRNNLQTFLDQRVPVFPTEEQINTNTTTYRAANRLVDICTICQDSIEENQEVRKINFCNHYYHRNCIDVWFRSNVHCPTCRHDIRDNQENNQPQVSTNFRRTNVREPDIV